MKFLHAAWNILVVSAGLTAIGCIIARFIVDPYVAWLQPIARQYGVSFAILVTVLIGLFCITALLIVSEVFTKKKTKA